MLSYQDIAMTPVLSSNSPVSHNVYVHRAGQSSFRTRGVFPGLCRAPTGQGAELGSCAMALGTPSTCRESSRATQVTQVTRGELLEEPVATSLLWCHHWVCQRCSLHMNRKWTVVQTRATAQLLQAELPSLGRGIQDSLVYAHQGKKTPNQLLQTPRNPFTKDGKFFYILFQNLSSIKS